MMTVYLKRDSLIALILITPKNIPRFIPYSNEDSLEKEVNSY